MSTAVSLHDTRPALKADLVRTVIATLMSNRGPTGDDPSSAASSYLQAVFLGTPALPPTGTVAPAVLSTLLDEAAGAIVEALTRQRFTTTRTCRLLVGETLRRYREAARAVSAAEVELSVRASLGNAGQESELKNLNHLAATVNDVNDVSWEVLVLSRNIHLATEGTGAMASATTELAASIKEINRNADAVADKARDVVANVEDGRQAMEELAEAMGAITDVTTESSRRAGELIATFDTIAEVLTVIEGIAKQTNLLALNATIEAARAGELGKGFAIVANEVKQLAGQTASATDSIGERIEEMRRVMNALAAANARSEAVVDNGRNAIALVSRTMSGVSNGIGEVAEGAVSIAGVVGQQTEASGEIAARVDRVAQLQTENETVLKAMADKIRASNDRFSDSAKSWFKADNDQALCEMAKIDHVLFKKKVVDVLMDHDRWSAAEVPDHHGCRLGRWYDAVKQPALRQHPAYLALVQPHQRVHDAARRALAAKAAGQIPEAIAAVAELQSASAEVLKGLEALAQAIGGMRAAEAGTEAPYRLEAGACCPPAGGFKAH